MEDYPLPEQDRLILDSLDRFLDRDVRPYVRDFEDQDIYPQAMVDGMAEMGLFGVTIPEEYGGLGLRCLTYARITETVSRTWMSLSGTFSSHLIMAETIRRFGTDAQREKWLPKFATGELRGGISLTEPNAGTDLQAITTRAARDGDKYIVNGAKMWATNSHHGDILAVLVKTDPDATPRHAGISLLLIEQGSPGFPQPKKLRKLGYRGVDTGEPVFENCEVPAENLIGEVEGEGFKQIMSGLELGRINVAARGVGVAQSALDLAVRYSQERYTFGKPICEHQAIQLKLADMATRVEAARLLTYRAAMAYDTGERSDMEAGMAKLFATEAAVENSLESMRIHGGYGYSKEFDVERLYRDAPLLAIGEGTNELQRIVIARQLIARNPI
jgi:alkylation response protein AidB-like acyl-CoA dehydrogenase